MLAIVCPIAGVALVVVLVIGVVIGCLARKLIKGRYNRQTAKEDRGRADTWFEKSQNPNLTAEQKDTCLEQVAKCEEHARVVTCADEVESEEEEEEDTESQSRLDGVYTPEDTTQF